MNSRGFLVLTLIRFYIPELSAQTHVETLRGVKGVPDSVTTTRPLLRSSPINKLSDANVKVMLRKHDFYCKDGYWSREFSNSDGRGLENEFQTQKNDQVVFDAATALTWQQSGFWNKVTFKEAERYIQGINSEKYAGFSDWRLPTLEEAISLVEPKKNEAGLYIDSVFDKTQTWIWTSDKKSLTFAWVVQFDYGFCWDVPDNSDPFVRAVR